MYICIYIYIYIQICIWACLFYSFASPLAPWKVFSWCQDIIQASHHIISPYHHNIIILWNGHTIISYLHHQRKCVSRFWSKSQRKSQRSSFNPITKERNDLKLGGNEVIFRGQSASNIPKFVAPPKQAIFDFVLTFCSENFTN